MIVGHGIDIVEIGRIQRLVDESESDWLFGTFTEDERRSADAPPNDIRYFAGRFAAKEAVAKALGTGFSGEIAFTDVEIARLPTGAPSVVLRGGAAVVTAAAGITDWHVSISHSAAFAVATAIAVRQSPVPATGPAPSP